MLLRGVTDASGQGLIRIRGSDAHHFRLRVARSRRSSSTRSRIPVLCGPSEAIRTAAPRIIACQVRRPVGTVRVRRSSASCSDNATAPPSKSPPENYAFMTIGAADPHEGQRTAVELCASSMCGGTVYAEGGHISARAVEAARGRECLAILLEDGAVDAVLVPANFATNRDHVAARDSTPLDPVEWNPPIGRTSSGWLVTTRCPLRGMRGPVAGRCRIRSGRLRLASNLSQRLVGLTELLGCPAGEGSGGGRKLVSTFEMFSIVG